MGIEPMSLHSECKIFPLDDVSVKKYVCQGSAPRYFNTCIFKKI